MLTVLHRKSDGSEVIFEVESVTRLATGQGSIPPLGKIYVRGVEDVPGEYGELEIEPPFGAVFVMNRHGSTVAKYLD